MLLLLDNFDSFTYNLNDYLMQCGAEVKVLRNDIPLSELVKYSFKGIILSPGPGVPENSGNLLEVINHYHQSTPILGICLGHQALGTFFGATLEKAIRPMHGKISEVNLEEDFLFKGIGSKINVTRYHSLILNNITSSLSTIAETNEGEIMAIRHNELPLRGIQFHPEAIRTEKGLEMLSNWLTNYNLLK